ncbi:MAG: hypothetical protein GF400_04900 [Candidatus Eisenbacteria bacterium]|nr:hypothetical protein [Candidatus Eisenbacteria bacterium]
MKRRIKRAPLPDAATIRDLLGERSAEIRDGAVVVDADARGESGVDLLMADEQGRPIFVDIVGDDAAAVPARVFEHLDWLRERERLFLKAYGGDGVRSASSPEIVFVAETYPGGALRSLEMIDGVAVRLLRAEYFVIDGEGELFLEEVGSSAAERALGRAAEAPRENARDDSDRTGVDPTEPSREEAAEETWPPGRAAVAEPAGERATEPDRTTATTPSLDEKIESESVRGLLGLFRSGVDGLDGRIVESELDGGITYELEGRRLARVSASAGSFTVAPGDRAANPIVVSDRVSLERALNAVVSLFVREGQSPGPAERGDTILGDEEREELVGIWGEGVPGADN